MTADTLTAMLIHSSDSDFLADDMASCHRWSDRYYPPSSLLHDLKPVRALIIYLGAFDEPLLPALTVVDECTRSTTDCNSYACRSSDWGVSYRLSIDLHYFLPFIASVQLSHTTHLRNITGNSAKSALCLLSRFRLDPQLSVYGYTGTHLQPTCE